MNLKDKAKQIHNLLLESKNPYVFYDCDCDGTMSYFILRNTFPNLRGSPLGKDLSVQEIVAERVSEKHDLIICIDTPFISEVFLDKIKDKKIIWIDHHIGNSTHLIEKYSLVHLNPLNYDPLDSRPSCYLAHLVTGEQESNLWRVSLGSVIDFYLLDVLIHLDQKFREEFNILFKISEPKKTELFDFINSKGSLDLKFKEERSNWIRYLTYECEVFKFKHFIDLLFKVKKVEEASNYINFLFSLDPLNLKIEIENGTGVSEEIREKLEFYSQILKKKIDKNSSSKYVYIYHTGEMSFNRQLCEELSYRFKNSDVILSCFEDTEKERFGCSVRSKSINIQKIVTNSLVGLDGSGGGHENSSGVSITSKDFPKFKSRFDKEVNNQI